MKILMVQSPLLIPAANIASNPTATSAATSFAIPPEMPGHLVETVKLRLQRFSYRTIGKELDIKQSTVYQRLQRALTYLPPEFHSMLLEKGADARTISKMSAGQKAVRGRNGTTLTSRDGVIIRSMLKGHSFGIIAQKLEVVRNDIKYRWQKILPSLHPSTIETINRMPKIRLHSKYEKLIRDRQDAVRIFLEELSRPKYQFMGALTNTAKKLKISHQKTRRWLIEGGINPKAELARRRFQFMLEVEARSTLSCRKAADELECSYTTISNYRTAILEKGALLRGPLELVGSPEAEEWWNMDLPAVKGRINMAIRNESVLKDLKFFDRVIEKNKALQLKWHPDRYPEAERKKAEKRFNSATRLRRRLKNAKAEYIEKECEFRRHFNLPFISELEIITK